MIIMKCDNCGKEQDAKNIKLVTGNIKIYHPTESTDEFELCIKCLDIFRNHLLSPVSKIIKGVYNNVNDD